MPAAETDSSSSSLCVARPKDVSKGCRSGSPTRRTSMRSILTGASSPVGGLAAGFFPWRDLRGAPPAEAEDVVAMPLDDEADVGRDLVLDPLDVGARELEDRVAGVADEVVVVLTLVLPLEAGLALQLQLLGEARGVQELEGPVDRGAPD